MSLRNTVSENRGKLAAGLLALAVALGLVAVGSTGAYFSDSHDGTISGTVGSVRVTPAGSTDFTFDNLLPGEAQTATLQYQNSGNNPQDVWVVFPNATALSALNDLGTYGEVHVTSNGQPVFDSANLSDHASTCGAFAPDGCWPLPKAIKLASNVAPGHSGVMKFSFNYASKLKAQPAAGQTAPFNAYPTSGQTTKENGVTGSGLPYQLVATQVGQQP